MDALLRNVAYAVRTLARTPAFTATVVLTLALGIGANSAVFSAIDTVLLRPQPFPGGDQLVFVDQTREASGASGIAPIRVEDWAVSVHSCPRTILIQKIPPRKCKKVGHRAWRAPMQARREE